MQINAEVKKKKRLRWKVEMKRQKAKDIIHRSPDKKHPCPSGRRGGHNAEAKDKKLEVRRWTID